MLNNLKKRALTLLLSLAMIITYMPVSMITAYAAAGNVPDHTKTLTDNKDGTYTLALDVTGDADTTSQISSVNVLFILDTSSSMSDYFYVPSETGHLGIANRQEYFDLYYQTGPNTYTRIPDDTSVPAGTTVYRRNGNGTYFNPYTYEEYTDPRGRYAQIRRAAPTEQSLYNFIDALFAYQDQNNQENIQVDIEMYNGRANTLQDWTSDKDTVLNKLSHDGIHYHGGNNNTEVTNGTSGYYASGTNWEAGVTNGLAALRRADNDPTYVIFFTDGEPTRRGNQNENNNQLEQNYQAAAGPALQIQQAIEGNGGNFYGIYAYGDEDDWLATMTYYVHNNGDVSGLAPGQYGNHFETPYYYYANNTNELQAAVDEIFSKITETLGVKDVEIDDGTTHAVTTSTGVADLLEVDTDSFEYWLEIPVDANNQFVLPDKISGENVTYTVAAEGNNITITWGNNGSATYPGTINNGKVTLKWTGATSFYDSAPPEATFTDGHVDWDLNTLGTLLTGVTYRVSFLCYPSQYTYDTIAQLKNGDITYDSLDSEIKKYIVDNGGGSYSLRTNTNATLSYDDTRDEEGKQTVDYTNPDPVATDAETLTVKKDWEGGKPTDVPDSLDMTVLMDDEEFHKTTLSDENSWSSSSYISIGIIKDDKVLEGAEGHDFTFAELDGSQYHWELESPTVHPMLIDGKLTMLIKVDADHPAQGKTYTIGNNTYYVSTEDAGLKAVNHRRSSLDLTKVVTGEDAPKDAKFPFALKVNNSKKPESEPSDEEDPGHDSDWWVWLSIRDEKGNGVTGLNLGSGVVEDSGGYYYAPSGTTFNVEIGDGWSLRFLNLPTGSTYTFAEGTLPTGFVFKQAELTSGTDTSFNGAKTSTGTIQETKTSYAVKYTNDYQLTNLEITKVWNDNGNQDGIRPSAEEFKRYLVLKADGMDVTSDNADKLEITDNGDNTYTVKWTGLDRYADGKEITYTVEETTIKGYTTTGSPASDGGTITNTHYNNTKEVYYGEKEYSVDGSIVGVGDTLTYVINY